MSLAQLKNTGDLEGLLPIGVSTTSMLAYYPLNGITDVRDYVNGLDGTVGGGISAVDRYGRANKAIYYNGNEAGVTIPITSTAGTYSFSCWVNLVSENYSAIFSISTGTSIMFLFYRYETNVIQLFDGGLRTFAISSIYGSWVHIGITFMDSTKKSRLYLNGVFQSEISYVTSFNISGTIKIGSRYAALGGTNWMSIKGSISEFAIWERIITDSEITALYNGQKAEFSEISYAGKGDGSSVYIDTGIKPINITNFEITFKWAGRGTANENLFGVLNDANRRFYFTTRAPIEADSSLALFASTVAIQFAPYLILNNKYTLSLTITNSGHTVNCIFTNLTTNSVVLNTSYTNNSYLLEDTNNLYIYCMNWSSKFNTYSTIYSFTINSETWYINNGTGNTITGSNGTVLTVNGTLTNFWQQSDIWNEDANLKMYNTGVVKCNEFDEVATTYAGKGDGSSIYIDTGIPANTALYYKIKFKYKNYVSETYKGLCGVIETVSSIHVLMFSAINKLYASFGSTRGITSGMTFQDATVYTIEVTLSGSTYTIKIYSSADVLLETLTNTFAGSLPTLNFAIFRRTGTTPYASYWWNSEIYSFQINSETWNIDRGYGNTITGSLGTVLNISALNNNIYDFWQIKDRTIEQYCGKGNGTNVYIDTGILPKDISYLKIRKTYNITTGSRGHGARDTSSSPTKVFLITTISPNDREYFYIGLSANTTATTISALKENQIYDYIIERTSDTVCNCKVIDMDGVVKLNSNITFAKADIDAIIQTIKIGFVTGYSYSLNKVYSFQINDETWYINNGSGTTITGDKGTVLTVSGTTTSFWQPSEIWNDPAQMKLLENELDIRNEIIEV